MRVATPPRSDEVDPIPPQWLWQWRWTPTYARFTPTSMACSPPIRALCRLHAVSPVIDYESMLEMSSCGSKVLALRCVEYAQRFDMPLHVRSSFSHRRGTLIVPEGVDPRTLPNI